MTSNHADVMYPILLDECIYIFLPEEPPESVDALRKRYEFLSSGRSPDGSEHWLNWILFELSSEKPIGVFQATVRANGCSVAYLLNPRFWNQGYATEASQAIITHLFMNFKILSITAEINPQNEASQRFIKRLGFSFSRYDVDEDDDIFEVTRNDWLLRNQGK